MDYTLTITPTDPDQPPAIRTITCDTPAEVAQAVHHHARGLLGGQIDVHLDTTGLSGDLVQHHARVGAFTLQSAEAVPVGGPGPLHGTAASADALHGYTLHDIDRLARAAVATAWPRAMDYTDRFDAAWHAITEALCETDQAPTRHDLKITGAAAVNRLAQDHYHTWGMSRRSTLIEGTMPAYQRYWELARRATPSPEGMVVDRAALWQIWPRLSATHQTVLTAMAMYADNVLAAEAVGKSYATFNSHLRNARREFFALWHEHETPSRFWGKSDRRHGRRTATQVLVNRRQQRARRYAA